MVNPAALFLQRIHFLVTHAPALLNIYKSIITAVVPLVLIPPAPRRDQNISVHLLQMVHIMPQVQILPWKPHLDHPRFEALN
jgi:hypothetical protein